MKSKPYFTRAEAEKIIQLIREKLAADPVKQKGIRYKIRKLGFYASDYGFRDGYTVEQFLRVAKIVDAPGSTSPVSVKSADKKAVSDAKPMTTLGSNRRDEGYILDLCDEVLELISVRQHRFDFLVGDSGSKLPVDAYYPMLNLVIEYREKQHTETVKFFDKKLTVSGVSRGEQRKIYDRRRREILPKHGISLIEFDYSEFEHRSNKKLSRNREADLKVIKSKISKIKRLSS